jgi:hypothetical protein
MVSHYKFSTYVSFSQRPDRAKLFKIQAVLVFFEKKLYSFLVFSFQLSGLRPTSSPFCWANAPNVKVINGD